MAGQPAPVRRDLHAQRAHPASSTFTGPRLVPVADYNEICARANTVACIPEPAPGEKVDGLSDRVMFSAMTQFSSVYVAARTPGDPAGAIFGPLVLASGGGVQVSSYKRWGDYSSMTVDPKDDCTFWYTQEYYTGTGTFNWATRIGAFKFDNCTPGSR